MTVVEGPVGGWVERRGGVVVKTHAVGVRPAELRARLRAARSAALDGLVVRPLGGVAERGGRLVTRWPRGEPVDPAAPERYPWGEAGALLRRLHAVPLADLPGPLPAAGGPARVARTVARVRAEVTAPQLAAARRLVERAHRNVPGRGGERALCHGDFHLGQLVRLPAGGWRLIDVDDLGVGDPAWDLGRPAAWYAAGLLPPADWQRLLTGYGLAEDGGLWARLDAPARAFAVQGAARALLHAQAGGGQLDDEGLALVEACGRIGGLP
ncbi:MULTISPECIES: phosphotransferase [Streptomyces]|nr:MULTISPECIES: phosphotransferase [Streptomyces]